MEILATIFHGILWVVLLALLLLYLFLAVFTNNKVSSLFEGAIELPPELSKEQKENYVRSMRQGTKAMLRLQGWLLVFASIILVIFDSKFYIGAAMFTATAASAHFYFSRKLA